MKAPNVFTFEGLRDATDKSSCSRQVKGRWVPLRPQGFGSLGSRLRASWLVFSGKADALIWPEDQD